MANERQGDLFPTSKPKPRALKRRRKGRRGPETDAERRAAEGLLRLAPDNFKRTTRTLGRQLADRVDGGLTEPEWALAIATCAANTKRLKKDDDR